MVRLFWKMTILPVAAAAALLLSGTARTAQKNGDPDLTGVWLVDEFHPALFPNGGAPFTPWGEAKFKKSDRLTNDPNLACLPHGIPRLMAIPLPFEIFQVPGRVLLYQEAGNQLRQIYLNRPHPKEFTVATYNGDSVGKWEGDTLVVDTVNFNDVTWLDHAGLPHSNALHVVERIRRVDHETLRDDFTVEDPKAYAKAWSSSQVYKLKPGWEIAEYTCDNNKYVYHPDK
jgi:hypothetical protein